MKLKSLDLQREYQERFSNTSEYRNDVWKILCNDFFSAYISEKDTILDLGAGWGEFTRNVIAGKKFSMDLNPDCGSRVEGHATFINQDCSNKWPFEDETLDVVFTSNFLEHLPNKVLIDKTLHEAFRCLKSGGKIICLGPNIKYLPGLYWDFWDHYTPITEESLAEALILSDFKIINKIARFLPYSMSGKRNPPLIAVKIYLKLSFIWKYFGKQFLVVAQKP